MAVRGQQDRNIEWAERHARFELAALAVRGQRGSQLVCQDTLRRVHPRQRWPSAAGEDRNMYAEVWRDQGKAALVVRGQRGSQ